jgi:NAD+ kinase
MPRGQNIPKSVAIATHPNFCQTGVEVAELKRILKEGGIRQVFCDSIHSDELLEKIKARTCDVLIALGGDGTMMRAARLAAPFQVPVLGINLGHFGFLMEIQRQDWNTLLPQFIQGKYSIEERILLKAEHWRKQKMLGSWLVVNDAVVSRGQLVRPINITAKVEGYELASYVADGLIVATPTGSTAYALAVGGPIMPPELRNILIIPIAPHRSLAHAIILSEGTCITLTVQSSHQAVLSVDGQTPSELENDDEVKVNLSEHTARFIRLHEPGFFYRNLINSMNKNSFNGGEA